MVPQLRGHHGALVDRKPIQLGSPAQFILWHQAPDLVPTEVNWSTLMAWTPTDLVTALRQQVLDLEADLRERVDGEDHSARQPGVWQAWESDYNAAFTAQRTAATWQQWRNERVTQAAVSWVLLTVFARYCEDNALVTPRWIGGADPDERTQALDARRAYFQAHPEHTDREWLGQIIDHFAQVRRDRRPGGLLLSTAPGLAPPVTPARALLEFWWQQGVTANRSTRSPAIDTRFLGDAYQDLSEYAKKTYALLQTPEFVEEFILDQTLEPALADRPLEGFTGHRPDLRLRAFPTRRFHRLTAVATSRPRPRCTRNWSSKALDSVYGVDINPFASRSPASACLCRPARRRDTSIEAEDPLHPTPGRRRQPALGRPPTSPRRRPAHLGHTVRADSHRKHRGDQRNPAPPPRRRRRQPALHHTQRRRAEYDVLGSLPHAPLKYALTVPFMELFFRLATQPDRNVRRLGRANHLKLIHETRVRLQTHRGIPAYCRPAHRHRHLRRLHPRPRNTDRRHHRTKQRPRPTRFAPHSASEANQDNQTIRPKAWSGVD